MERLSNRVQHQTDSIGKAYASAFHAFQISQLQLPKKKKLAYQKDAITCCQQVIARTGTRKEQLKKIEAILLLIQLLVKPKTGTSWERDRCFYFAVELGKRYA